MCWNFMLIEAYFCCKCAACKGGRYIDCVEFSYCNALDHRWSNKLIQNIARCLVEIEIKIDELRRWWGGHVKKNNR